MNHSLPSSIPREPFLRFLLAMADDEFILGHRDSEWTGHAPILEEDIAFSNIAQDEIGHSLVWLTMYEHFTGRTPDQMGFERGAAEFACCRFVEYPKGDFAYTVVRQYLFDVGEQVRLESLLGSSYEPLQSTAEKLLREETYHLLHSSSLVERLGDATEESHRRMQTAVDKAFPQSLGMFEQLDDEDGLIKGGVFPGNGNLQSRWLTRVVPALRKVSLIPPVKGEGEDYSLFCPPETGGRKGTHTEHLSALIDDVQQVYRIAPGPNW